MPNCRSDCWTDNAQSGILHPMNRTEADALADEVRAATGQDTRVDFEDEENGFVVTVPIARPRSGALSEEFTLSDDGVWESLRDRIPHA